MFKNVLVGVDGRPNGRDAIALASRLADPDGELTLAHVSSGELTRSSLFAPELRGARPEDSAELLERERRGADIRAELISVTARSPGRGLHERAEAQFADLLVVGSCSRGMIGRVVLGEDTRAALNGAPCAIAIAPRGYAEHPTAVANVGVGYDGSPESEAALAMARTLAGPTEATVHALEVVAIPTYAYAGLMPPAVGESIDVLLAQASARMKNLAGVDGEAVYGIPGEELAAFGSRVDLLIVGSRSYGPVRRLVLGSTSGYLERHARCPLLVLPRVTGRSAADAEHLDLPVATAV